jgi:uncharacterized protein YuzE
MKVTYDPNPLSDVLSIKFNDNLQFDADDSSIPSLTIMYDEFGKVCGIEILDATELVSEPLRMDFEVFSENDLADEE